MMAHAPSNGFPMSLTEMPLASAAQPGAAVGWTLAAAIILAVGGIVFAFWFAGWVRTWLDFRRARGRAERAATWLIQGPHLIAGGVTMSALVYKRWKTAPSGTPAKLLWSLLFGALIGLCLWLVLVLLDAFVNRRSASRPGPTE